MKVSAFTLRLLTLFVLINSSFYIAVGQASIGNYTPVRTTGNTYNSISSTGNAFGSWRNTISLPQDDNRSDFTDIGFDFWYNGTRYIRFSASTNGFIDFSASTDDGGPLSDDYGYDNRAFSEQSDPNATYLAIAPFYDNLTTQGGTAALGSSIKYLLSGIAPNRVLTVEWINMAVSGNTTPSLNFQVKLYETTGVIEINYGVMTQGTAGFSYTTGINGSVVNNPPTVSQMKVLQSVNTNTFSNTVQNSLATMPTAGSRYTLTPRVPTAASGTMTFSSVTQTGMTLNWSNWATNEVGYVVYYSTDNLTFEFVKQTAINATNTVITGLLPGTTYYWRLHAVTEGNLNTSLNGTQATTGAGNKVSNSSGNWNTAGTWTPSGVPTAGDNVTISNTHTVTINGDATCNNLTVGVTSASTLQIGSNNGSSFIFTPKGSITINTGSTLKVNAGSSGTHSVIVNNNIINNGTINFQSVGACNTRFIKSGNILISGTGATTRFNNVILNLGTTAGNILEITTPSFAAPDNFLTLTAGTFKLSTSGASSITPFTAAETIPLRGALWLNSSASTLNFSGNLTMYGDITVSSGTMNIGSIPNTDLISNGGQLTVSGGTLNIAGKYYSSGINALSKFTLTGGTVVVPAFGSTSTTIAPFEISGAGSQFTMSGGTLVIPREGGTGAQDLGFVNTGTSGGMVTGGILQIGNPSSPAAQTIQINSTFPIGNLLVNSANVTAQLLTNSLTVTADVTNTAGTLAANNLNFTVGGNWTNNGGTFIPGIGSVTFNGTGAQAINGAAVTQTFNDLIVAKTVGTTLSTGGSTSTIVANNYTQTTGNFTAPANFNVSAGTASNILLTAGILTAGTEISLTGNWTNNGATFAPGSGTTTFSGTLAQTIFKSGGETFNNMVFSNAGIKTLNSPVVANGDFTINTGSTVDVNAANYLVTIKGNLSNDGIFTTRSGNIFLNGTLAQTIGGATITDFYDLTLNNAAGASLLQDQNIINSLILNGGVFNVNGKNLTLVSTATGSGRIAEITGTGDFSGNVIVQRYTPGGYTGWAFLGSPLTSALTYSAWDDDIPISCTTCPDGSAGGFLSIYTYNETVAGLYDAPASYVPISTINDPIVNGKGYWVYFGDGFTTTNNITLDVTGTPRKFNHTIPLNYTNTGAATEDGWNLISNPFPSPILWTSLKGATTGIDNAIYVYNADLSGGAGSYATFVNGISSPAVGSGGIGNAIPICQGFYVHSTGATALNAQESNKFSGNPTFLRQNPHNAHNVNTQPQQLIRLYLDGLSTYHDETVLYIQDNSTNSFDTEYDSYKLTGNDPLAPMIALQNDTNDFQINGVAPIIGNFSMPVKTTTGYVGTFTITADNVSSFPVGACISLYDNYTGITTDLRNNSYSFSLSDTTQTARFVLNITIDPLQVNTNTNNPTCSQPNFGQIIAVGNNSGPWNYYWKDENGLPIKTSLSKSDPDTLDAMAGASYILEMNTIGGCDNNITPFTINSMDLPVAEFNCVDTIYLDQGATINPTNTSANAVIYNWSFGDASGIITDYQPSYQYLTSGVFVITLITESNTGCMDTTTQQVVVINDIIGMETVSNRGLSVKTLADNVYLVQQKLTSQQNISAKLMDLLGKELVDFGTNAANEINLSVDLSDFESGVYYLRLNRGNNTETVKLIRP